MFADQMLIRICLIIGSLLAAIFVLRRVRQAKVQIEDTIYWLCFSAVLLVLAFFPGIAYWASHLLGFQSPINFVYVVIIFLLLARQFFLSIRISQMDSRLRILTGQVALNQGKQEGEKLDLQAAPRFRPWPAGGLPQAGAYGTIENKNGVLYIDAERRFSLWRLAQN